MTARWANTGVQRMSLRSTADAESLGGLAMRYCFSAALVASLVTVGCGRPPLVIRTRGDSVTLDVQTLGEYTTSLRRIRLRGPAGTIWEIEALGRAPQIFTIHLQPGPNPARLPQGFDAGYRVISPEGSATFNIRRGVTYAVEVWGRSGPPARGSFQISVGRATRG